MPMELAISGARGYRSEIATDAVPRGFNTAAARRPIGPAPLTKRRAPSMRPAALSIPCRAMASGSANVAVHSANPWGQTAQLFRLGVQHLNQPSLGVRRGARTAQKGASLDQVHTRWFCSRLGHALPGGSPRHPPRASR